MNVRMDWLAKFASQQVKNKLIVPPKSSHHPLGFSPVTIHNRTIPHELGKSIYNVIAEKISHQWWLSKGRYNLNDIPLIHWEVCGSASATQSKNNQKFTSKWTTGHLATGRKMALWKKRAMDNCPFCLEPDEHTFHILTCPHAEATKVWDSSLETFIKSLTRLNTETEFLSTLTYDLHCWRNAQPYLLINSISTNLQPIFIHLRQIKYDKFLEGLIPKELIRHQEKYFRAQESCLQTGKSWGKKVYKLLWEFTNSIWLGRNQQLHDTDRIKELQGLPLVLQAIQSEYNLGLHRLPPSEFSMLFATSFEVLQKRSIDSLRHWLLTIRLGRNIHGGINKYHSRYILPRWTNAVLAWPTINKKPTINLPSTTLIQTKHYSNIQLSSTIQPNLQHHHIHYTHDTFNHPTHHSIQLSIIQHIKQLDIVINHTHPNHQTMHHNVHSHHLHNYILDSMFIMLYLHVQHN